MVDKVEVWYEETPLDRIDIIGNVRTGADEDLAGLMQSMNQMGVIQPIGLFVNPDHKDRRILVFGHRRFFSAQKLGWTKIPAVVSNEKMDEESMKRRYLMRNLVENNQRQDTNPAEDGRVYLQLQNELHMSISEIAASAGLSPNTVRTSILAFTHTPPEYRTKIGLIVGASSKKGKIPKNVQNLLAMASAKVSKSNMEKMWSYAASHDEATIEKLRMIVVIMTNMGMTFDQALAKSDEYKAITPRLIVKTKEFNELLEANKGKPMVEIVMDMISGKMEPHKEIFPRKIG